MLNEFRKFMDGYEVIPITIDNCSDAEAVYNSNQDFFLQVEGKEATKTGIIESVTAVPDGFDLKGKYFIGIWKNGAMVAVLDFLAGYPVSDCIWIGLLLVHGDLKGQSIGSTITTAIFNAAKSVGYTEIKLGVIDRNLKGIKFWLNMGFVQIGTSSTTLRGAPCEIVVFGRQLLE